MKTFTVTATDANGGVTAKTVTYDVGGNVTPVVDAGPDITTNGGSTVTLAGSAVDPDTGQILSYQWTQTAGAPVTLNPIDAADPFQPNQRFVAPRNGPFDLTFRLRVDDGYDTGEDSVNVHVNANNGPVITARRRPDHQQREDPRHRLDERRRHRPRRRHPDHLRVEPGRRPRSRPRAG